MKADNIDITISQEELMDVIEASLELEMERRDQGNEKWAEAFEIFTPLRLNLKELTLLCMKQIIPRNAIDVLADVLSLNIPIDALEAVQSQGKTALPNYRAMAYIFYTRINERLAEVISVQKEICQQKKMSDQALLAQLVRLIMKKLNIPTSGAGIAAILALILAKEEFNAFLDEE